MKKTNFMLLLLILACVAVFTGYRQFTALQTDKAAPEITISDSALQLSVREPKSALLQGVTAKDKRDGDVTDSLVVESIQLIEESGTVNVTYAAFDSAGNTAKAQREVQYTDYERPHFVLNAPLVYNVNSNYDIMSDVGAVDGLDGDIQHRIRVTMLTEASVYEPGDHYVHFKVKNSLGDTAELAVPVEVYETNDYNAKVTLTDYLIYLPVSGTFNPNAYLELFTYTNKEISLENGVPGNVSVKTNGTVLTQTPGVYPVEYTVTYIDRHETNSDYDKTYTAYTKLIVVVEG